MRTFDSGHKLSLLYWFQDSNRTAGPLCTWKEKRALQAFLSSHVVPVVHLIHQASVDVLHCVAHTANVARWSYLQAAVPQLPLHFHSWPTNRALQGEERLSWHRLCLSTGVKPDWTMMSVKLQSQVAESKVLVYFCLMNKMLIIRQFYAFERRVMPKCDSMTVTKVDNSVAWDR